MATRKKNVALTVSSAKVENAYRMACEVYNSFGVDPDAAISRLGTIPISLHCWQGDDVGGFERQGGDLAGSGLMATGGFPGKARTPDELRDDLAKALTMIPGHHRVNLHAIYLESGGKRVDRDEIEVSHFRNWMDWAALHGIGLDFNPTFFAHPKASSGLTLSHPDRSIRDFWVAHGRRCRSIASAFSRRLGGSSVVNIWIPDGMKDFPADRLSPRVRLAESLDRIFDGRTPSGIADAVESKLFGIGSEEYVVGSAEFYIGYALTRKKMLCLDMGHFHPTESIHDKVSSLLLYMPELLVHVSRPIRWDSDHVVILNDDLVNLARELVRTGSLDRVRLATDFFDASMNRIGAWVIGARSLQKSLLFALLEPTKQIQDAEKQGDFALRLALMEETKTLPFGAVWDWFCLRHDVPIGASWLTEMKKHETQVLRKRK